jgi:hypothetical protein
MPTFPFSSVMTANQLGLNPVNGWQYEYIPRPSKVSILVTSTTTGARMTIYSGSETIQERSPIQGGGTAGKTPSPLNTVPIQFFAGAGDRLKLAIDEVAGGTPTVDGIIQLDPIA